MNFQLNFKGVHNFFGGMAFVGHHYLSLEATKAIPPKPPCLIISRYAKWL